MSLPTYPAYKDSDVAWLGEVPEHWGIRRIKYLFEIKKRIAGTDGYDVLSITQQGIKVKDIDSGDGQLSMDYSKYQLVEVGDFAMNHMDLLTGYVDISHIPGVTSPDYRVFAVRDNGVCFDRYYLYLFQVGYRNKIFYAFGQGSSQLGRWRFPTDQFNSFHFPHPSILEQKEIANFLDRETTKIDELIAEQQRLIKLLKEKRQAVISHAVTKGLNPDAPMKDSGIEWLGEVPEHWEIKPLKIVVSMKSGEQITAEDIGEEGIYPVFGGNGLRGYTSNFTHEGYFPLIGRQGALCGNINYGKGKFWASEHAVVASPLLECSILWLGEILRTMKLGQYSITAAQPGLSVEAIGNLRIPFPPLFEQSVVATFLDRETTKIDELIAEAQRAIELLKERRAALISAAVTGKIDVRGLVADKLAVE
ncbi:MAG: restriction endonuclease subunit S [Nitrosomonas sp.]|nr:restriction endonuclease subunit S [Nitrosomonas sp.]